MTTDQQLREDIVAALKSHMASDVRWHRLLMIALSITALASFLLAAVTLDTALNQRAGRAECRVRFDTVEQVIKDFCANESRR